MSEKTYECFARGCEEKFSTNKERIDHIGKEHGEKILCPIESCEVLLRPSSIYNHIRETHEGKIGKAACDNCGKQVSERYIVQHRQRCTSNGNKEFKCGVDDCQASFTVKRDLRVHVSVVHVSTPVKCPYEGCNEMIKPASLRQHVIGIHDNVKRLCKSCGKLISTLYLKVHSETCSGDGEKTLPCTVEGCSQTFVNKHSRSSHINAVHRQTVKCPFDGCDKMIKPHSVPQHIREVHDKVRKKCRYCEKDCTPSSLKRHEKSCMKKCLGGPELPAPDYKEEEEEKFEIPEVVPERQEVVQKPPLLVIRCRKPVPGPEFVNPSVDKRPVGSVEFTDYWEMPNANNQGSSGWVGRI